MEQDEFVAKLKWGDRAVFSYGVCTCAGTDKEIRADDTHLAIQLNDKRTSMDHAMWRDPVGEEVHVVVNGWIEGRVNV